MGFLDKLPPAAERDYWAKAAEEHHLGWLRALDRAEAAEAQLAERTRERDEADAWIHEATKTITGLTAGGSEYFGRCVRNVYRADLPFCAERIRERFARADEHVLESVRERKAAEARASAAEARVRELEADVAAYRAQAGHPKPCAHCGGHYSPARGYECAPECPVVLEREHRSVEFRARALLNKTGGSRE